MNKGMLQVIDKVVENTIKKEGFYSKKTRNVVENAEHLKEKIENNLVKVF